MERNTACLSLIPSLLLHPSNRTQGDPEIDTSKVDSTAKVADYDGETQGALRKIMVCACMFYFGFLCWVYMVVVVVERAWTDA